jgi:hypothetical protein
MRQKLPDRREAINVTLRHELGNGNRLKFIITMGFDGLGNVREVFCADFKAGSDNQSVIMDACIILSRLLQYGDAPEELFNSMCSPPSLIGTIAAAIAREQAG